MSARTRLVPLLALCVALRGAPAGSEPIHPARPAVAPWRERTSDEVVARDLAAIGAVRARVNSVASRDGWRTARARALLVAARTEYLDGDRTAFAGAALTEARRLAAELEDGAAPYGAHEAPVLAPLPGTRRVHEELWIALATLAHGPGFECAAADLASAEVELQWAGNESVDRGECHVAPHAAAAQRWLAAAKRDAAGCPVAAAPPAVPPLAPATPAPIAAPARPAPGSATSPAPPAGTRTAMPTAGELRTPRTVSFAPGRVDLGEISRRIIASVARLLRRYPPVSVRLETHTDPRAGTDLDPPHARARIDAVKLALISAGVDSARVHERITAVGETAPKLGDLARVFARERRIEIVMLDDTGRTLAAPALDAAPAKPRHDLMPPWRR